MEKEFEAIQVHYGEEVARLKAQQKFQEQQFSLFVRNSLQKTRLKLVIEYGYITSIQFFHFFCVKNIYLFFLNKSKTKDGGSCILHSPR